MIPHPTTRPRHWAEAAGCLLAAGFLLLACSSSPKPAPPVPPALRIDVSHYAGSALGGPGATPLKLDYRDAWSIRCAIKVTRNLPIGKLTPIEPGLQHVVQIDQTVLRGTTDLRATRCAVGDVAAEFLTDATTREGPDTQQRAAVAALPVGATAVFLVAQDGARPLEARVHRDASAIQVALARPTNADTELVLLTEAPGKNTPLAAAIPWRNGTTLVLALAVQDRTQPSAAAMQRCRDGVARAREAVAQRTTPLSRKEAESTEFVAALKGLATPASRRQALTLLGERFAGRLTQHLALSATPAELEAFVTKARATIPAKIPTAAAVGWIFEREAYRFWRPGEETPSDSRQGALLHLVGAVAAAMDTLDHLLVSSRSIAEFETGVVEENRLSLEDTATSQRVRAFDWLQQRNLAPKGFDPLATAPERRRALEAAANKKGRTTK